jgi:hypothetical protein
VKFRHAKGILVLLDSFLLLLILVVVFLVVLFLIIVILIITALLLDLLAIECLPPIKLAHQVFLVVLEKLALHAKVVEPVRVVFFVERLKG